MAVAWLAGIAGSVALWAIPQRYEASAKIFVDTESVLKPLMVGLAVQPNVDQQVTMLSRRLISRPNIEKLIGMAKLDVNENSKSRKAALVESLIGRLEILTLGKENLYRLSFRDTDPSRAKRVVESLTSIFIQSSQVESQTDSLDAKKFIDEQIKLYEVKLSEAENRLKDFRIRHFGLSEGGKGFFARMEDVNLELSKARLDLREAENSRDSLRRAIAGEDPLLVGPSAVSDKGLTPEIDARIDAVRRNLDSLMQRFTEEHPDVAGAKRVLAQLEEQRRIETAAREKTPPSRAAGAVSANPAYKELKVSLAQAEATVASLRTRVGEYEARYRQIKDAARSVPQVEAELAQLNRDYEVNKKNYELLVTRRESAELSGQMEASAGVAQFRVVEPPRVSPRPVAPDRLKLLPVILLGALGVGVGGSFAVNRVWPTFVDVATLREATGLPVLGSVSFYAAPAERKKERRGLVGFLAALFGLIVVFGTEFAAVFMMVRTA